MRLHAAALVSSLAILSCASPVDDDGSGTSESDATAGASAVYVRETTWFPTMGVGVKTELHLGWFKKYAFFDLYGSVNDEVEIVADGGATAVLVLDGRDAAKVKSCEWWRARDPAYADRCVADIPYPVKATTAAVDKTVRARIVLTAPHTSVAIASSEWAKIQITSIRSGIDPSACQKGTPEPGSAGPFDVVSRARDCSANACGPWTEVWRRAEAGLDVGRQIGTTLYLVDEGGSYRTVRDGVATTAPCRATTVCAVSTRGDVSCEAFQRASVAQPRDHTALDSSTCGSTTVNAPRYSGRIGKRCVSLTAGVKRDVTGAGTHETEEIIVKDW